jgi:hypothetical protein
MILVHISTRDKYTIHRTHAKPSFLHFLLRSDTDTDDKQKIQIVFFVSSTVIYSIFSRRFYFQFARLRRANVLTLFRVDGANWQRSDRRT